MNGLKLGVSARLMTGLAALTIFAGAAVLLAVTSFGQFRTSFDRVASTQLNAMMAAAQLKQESEAVTGLAPGLLAQGYDQGSLLAFSTMAYTRQTALQQLIEKLRIYAAGTPEIESIQTASQALFSNADELSTAIFARANVEASLQKSLSAMSIHYQDSQRLASGHSSTGNAAQWSGQLGTLSALVLHVLSLRDRTQLQYTEIEADKILSNAAAFSQASGSEAITALVDKVHETIRGAQGIFRMQGQKLDLEREVKHLLDQNDAAARNLVSAVDGLVGQIQSDIAGQNNNLGDLLASRSQIMFALAISGLIGALAIATYFQKSVVGRVNKLRQAMRSGRTTEAVELARGHDEISEMARAFIHFVGEIDRRDEAVRKSQQRLTNAIESISDGFSLYDSDDVLVTCNSHYRSMLYHGMEDLVQPGQRFESIIRSAAEKGLIPDALGRVDDWVSRRVMQHRRPKATTVQQRSDGRWIEIRETRAESGDAVAIYTDITERKNFENQLQEEKQRTDEANQLAMERNRMLEGLSAKLSKYLSPQVYDSIFAGRQEVAIESKRKKLTIFFSDIADFTETTDNLESEQVTELLNSYLTEMSRIALQFGATVDKYVGDAILIFFGDPESRGVKEDATACVEMAIAMQRRMMELQAGWLERGLERPFQLRIGINTGFCTVGNFGSEDRMDYTIIGSEVNLAARLQAHTPLGGILLAHETYALVRDSVNCTERDPIQVKGFAKPVRNYAVLGIHSDINGADIARLEASISRLQRDLNELEPAARNHIIAMLQNTFGSADKTSTKE